MRLFLIPALLGLAARLSSASALDDWAALSEANTAFFCYDEAGCVVSEPSPRKQDVSGPRLVSKLAPDGSYSLLLIVLARENVSIIQLRIGLLSCGRAA